MGILEGWNALMERKAAEQHRALSEGGRPQPAAPDESQKTAEVTDAVLDKASAPFRDETGT